MARKKPKRRDAASPEQPAVRTGDAPGPSRAAEPRSAGTGAAGPALAMLEIADAPRGLRALDALIKEAWVEIASRGTVQCGRYLIAFTGQVEAVQRSFGRALAAASGAVRDQVLLPDAEPRILPAFRDAVMRPAAGGDALGVIESATCPSILAVVDAALKGAQVELVELRLADGLGGKALATLWGRIFDVEAAIELAERAFARHVAEVAVACSELSTVVIPNADPETHRAVSAGTRFFQEWRG